MHNRALHDKLFRHALKVYEAREVRVPVPLLWRDGNQLTGMQGEPLTVASIKARVIDYHRFPSQQTFHDLPVPFKGFSGPIGSGKSKALVHEAIRCAYRNPGVEGLIGSPTYQLLRDSTQRELLSTLEEQNIPHRFYRTENRVHLLEPDSTILLRSLDRPERLRAMNLGWFGVDELTYCTEAAWVRLEGRLRHPKARVRCGFAVWTPNGKDWVYRRFVSTNKISTYHVVRAQPSENRAVLDESPDYYENLKHSYSDKFYRQEVLGEYLNQHSGLVYDSFSDANVQPCSFAPAEPLIIALDFNVNPMAGLLLQCDKSPNRKVVRVLEEIVLPSSNTASWVEECIRRIDRWSIVMRRQRMTVHFYGDATGGSRQTTSHDSNWTIIQKRMGAEDKLECRFLYPKKNPAVVDRVNAVNGMLCTFGDAKTPAAERRLLINSSCKELIADLEDVSWKVDAHGNSYPEIDKTSPKRTHTSDALGYYMAQEHGFAPRAFATKQTF